jgi:DNA-binding NarL/FixJ family response regulator
MSYSKGIRVLIAEPNEALREVLTEYLKLEKDIELVGSVADREQMQRLCQQLKPDVLIIDPALQADRVAFTHALHQECPGAKVILLTDPYTAVTPQVAQEAGMAQYVEKASSPQSWWRSFARSLPLRDKFKTSTLRLPMLQPNDG